MALTIYHNPRCSKSRKTLQLISDAGIEPVISLYLKNPPDGAQIVRLAERLGEPVVALLRQGETEFKQAKDLPNLDDDVALADWLSAHPIVLQRPIVVDEDSGRAVVGRPPENVLELLG
jgi:arsenate reductase